MSENLKKLYGVITTIQGPTECMNNFASAWPGEDGSLLIVGDSKGPFEYDLQKTTLLDIETQRHSKWNLTRILPEKHYARKNLGYLHAIDSGATTIYETDDDNQPKGNWTVRDLSCESISIDAKGWYNVYGDFSKEKIWPRGLPLNEVLTDHAVSRGDRLQKNCPIQQGLADGSPDVDAVWRLILDKNIQFDRGDSVRLKKGTWCPFNSQSTWWWKEAYALMYLPSYCPFRMTDIWRSFVAQRCLWELGYDLVFHEAEVHQERNPHDPMLDFKDEVPGYLRNEEIRQCLEAVELEAGQGYATSNLRKCYDALVKIELIPQKEMELIDAWIADLGSLGIE